eukprot:gene12805-14743_t
MGSVITVTLVWFEMIIFLGIVSDIVNVPNIASSTLLPLVEENTGRRVFLVSPDVTVASPPYRQRQVYGVKWLFSEYATNDSAILGDDMGMGMGKTVPMAAFLNVVFMKSGTMHDKCVAQFKRNGTLMDILHQVQSGAISRDLSSTIGLVFYGVDAPATFDAQRLLVDNWARELKLWGYFLVDVLSNQCDADQTADMLRRARDRRSEIVLVSYSQIDRFVAELERIHWDVIVFDEGHKLKNEQSKSYKDIMRIKHCASKRPTRALGLVELDLQRSFRIQGRIHQNH